MSRFKTLKSLDGYEKTLPKNGVLPLTIYQAVDYFRMIGFPIELKALLESVVYKGRKIQIKESIWL